MGSSRENDGLDRSILTIDDFQILRLSSNTLHHRIITSNMNVAVVHQEGICEFGESFARFIVVCGDGFFGEIAAGHDQRWKVKG